MKEARAKAQELLEDVRREAREASVRTARLRRDAQEFRAGGGEGCRGVSPSHRSTVSSVEEVDAEPPALVDEAGRRPRGLTMHRPLARINKLLRKTKDGRPGKERCAQ